MTATEHDLVPVLAYHSIANEAAPLDLRFTVAPEMFRAHMDALARWGAHTISVTEYADALRRRRGLPPRTVVITVDDGYADTAETLGPALGDEGFTATVFVTTGTIGTVVRQSRMITWSQVRQLQALGLEIGAHAHHHIALDTVGRRRARWEMTRSRLVLEEWLDTPVTSFAYPHGYWTATLKRVAAESGYLVACTANRSLSHPADDLFALSRVVVHRDVTPELLLDLVDGRGIGTARSSRSLQRAAWRFARWVRDGKPPSPAGRARDAHDDGGEIGATPRSRFEGGAA